MKKHLFTLLVLCISILQLSAQGGSSINTSGAPADPSAMLDVSSLDKGVLIPRLTQAQKNLITNPANGLTIYQTDQDTGFYFNAGTALIPVWVQLMPNPANTDLNMNSHKIVNLATCTTNDDAANKAYVDNAVSAGGGGGSITQVSANQCPSGCSLTDCRTACIALGADWHVPTFDELNYVAAGFVGTPPGGFTAGNVWTTTPGWYGLVGSPSGNFQYGKFMFINESSWGVSYNTPSTLYSCRCVK